jgi:hypothetical protein
VNSVTASPAFPDLVLQTTTAIALDGLLPRLEANLRSSGVWLAGNRQLSPGSVDLSIELHHRDAGSLCTALVGSGLELSHCAHVALASLCSRASGATSAPLNLRLEVRCLTSHYHSRYPPRLAISA